MSDKDPKVYIKDILDEINNCESFTAHLSKEEEFAKDLQAAYATARSLEILSEAAKKIPKSIKDKYPNVAWKEMVGMRDKLIHDYANTRTSVIWTTIKDDLPKLKEQLIKLMAEVEDK